MTNSAGRRTARRPTGPGPAVDSLYRAEVVDEGVTGFLVRDEAEMLDRIRRIGEIDRARCRARARERFNSARMARDYERVYASAIASRRDPRPLAPSGIQLARTAAR